MLLWEWVFHPSLFNSWVQAFGVDGMLEIVSKMHREKENTYLHARLVFSKQFSAVMLIAFAQHGEMLRHPIAPRR